jgi:hypothetical protein
VERACESCGFPGDELGLVRRVYLDPDAIDQIKQVEPQTELWCMSCRSQYPHQPVEGDS